jgi:hypothetical protein
LVHFSGFGVMHQEKSGNPEVELSEVIRTIAKLGVIYGNRGGKFF